ncbi:MAG TPA: AMP-binding protein [Pseudonocardiaceae bacterium]|nr:AMP-binding protein [Pseudonocardiaceae bacterium]
MPSSASTSGTAVSTGRNVADLVSAAARRDPAHPALPESASGRGLSWGQLDAAVNGEAARLTERGLRPGDRVVLRMPTSVPFCVSLFGALRAGGVAVPVGPGASGRELERVLDSCTARLLVAAAQDLTVEEAAGRAGVVRLDPPAWEEAGDAAPPAVEAVTGGEDLAVLVFTSGTSGNPRGVMLSHRALLANLAQCAALRPAPVTAADRVLLALPLFHSYGLGPGLLQVANSAATGVLAERFDAEESLEAVHRHRVTVVAGVPPMYLAWLRLPPERLAAGMRTVRMFSSGAAPLDPAVLDGIREATGLPVFEGYGLTETGPVLTSTLVGGVPKPGSVGRPLPGVPSEGVDPVELRLVDAGGRPLPTEGDDEDAGGTGIVAARGPNLFSGYWPDGARGPAELPGLGQGWIRTGDVGYLDADGDLHLVDRVDDLIIVNGFNVYPREVEEVLLEHPRVREAAAIGVPNERTGEAVRAVLVAAEGTSPSVEEIIEHCTRRLARFKVPVEVALVDTLPYLPTGKLARRTLRQDIPVTTVPPADTD